MKQRYCAVLMIVALAACGSATEPRGGNDRITQAFTRGFSGSIIGKDGNMVGTITATPGKQGLIVAFAVRGLSPGQHAIHLHSVGRCDPPAFATSGSHWNPSGHQHGTDNPAGPHDGDWDNLDVGSDGRGSSNRMIPRWHRKIPESGLSLVIHANKDDEVTDPDGKSGERIACAVVIPPA